MCLLHLLNKLNISVNYFIPHRNTTTTLRNMCNRFIVQQASSEERLLSALLQLELFLAFQCTTAICRAGTHSLTLNTSALPIHQSFVYVHFNCYAFQHIAIFIPLRNASVWRWANVFVAGELFQSLLLARIACAYQSTPWCISGFLHSCVLFRNHRTGLLFSAKATCLNVSANLLK